MVAQHYRWDFIGLSTDTKPTPETSEKVVDGSTFYCSDNSKLYVFYKDTWYEKTVSGGGGTTYTAGTGIDITGSEISVDTATIQEKLTAGTGIDITDNTISATGGGGVTVVQTGGNSETDVMSQKATTSLVYHDPSTRHQIQLGDGTSSSGSNTCAVGNSSQASGKMSSAFGYSALTTAQGALALGLGASVSAGGTYSIAFSGGDVNQQGIFQVGTNRTGYTGIGYNNTDYRIIRGVHDGIDLHDSATVAQGNTLATSAPTTSTVGVLGQLYTDTTNMHTYQCTAISGDTYTWTQRW